MLSKKKKGNPKSPAERNLGECWGGDASHKLTHYPTGLRGNDIMSNRKTNGKTARKTRPNYGVCSLQPIVVGATMFRFLLFRNDTLFFGRKCNEIRCHAWPGFLYGAAARHCYRQSAEKTLEPPYRRPCIELGIVTLVVFAAVFGGICGL